jgi:two-component system cell cycle response regulator
MALEVKRGAGPDAEGDELLSAIVDDLGGPVVALVAYARRAARDPATPEAQRRTFAFIERQAVRIAAVVEGLASVRELQGGRFELQRRDADLVAVVARAADDAEKAARARRVTITRELPPHPLALSVDAERLAAAVATLLAGAAAATPRGGRVRVAIEVTPSGPRITVEDGRRAGPRGSSRPARPRPGRGVELASCRSVVELHGGALEIERCGARRTARIVLPTDATTPAAAPARPGAGGRARLLVVDDDPDARDVLAMMLGDDYDVQLAADGKEAVELAQAAPPDLVLMDVYMPRLDGLAALAAMREESLTAEVPVILVSGQGDELTRAHSLDLGAVDFLQKPFSPRELKARIERTLRLTRRESELAELARTDPLTGLANRRAFRARLDDEVKRARRYRTPLACVMMDLDHLKPINDELGHAAGDVAIEAVAEVIRRELRETDFGARYGGDEFVILLPHTAATEAGVFAERVIERLREAAVEVDGRVLHLGASLGVAALGDDALDGDAGEALVRRADAALYEAKRSGRGRVVGERAPGEGAAGGSAAGAAAPP